jgi:hypothetical protein
LSRVDPDAPFNLGFEGRILWPGAQLPESELPAPAVVLEYAGPQGKAVRGKPRDHLYILWRYDWSERRWVEIVRTLARAWEWAPVFRRSAALELAPAQAELVDVAGRGRELAGELLALIDSKLENQPPGARVVALTTMFDQIAGRIAAANRQSSGMIEG